MYNIQWLGSSSFCHSEKKNQDNNSKQVANSWCKELEILYIRIANSDVKNWLFFASTESWLFRLKQRLSSWSYRDKRSTDQCHDPSSWIHTVHKHKYGQFKPSLASGVNNATILGDTQSRDSRDTPIPILVSNISARKKYSIGYQQQISYTKRILFWLSMFFLNHNFHQLKCIVFAQLKAVKLSNSVPRLFYLYLLKVFSCLMTNNCNKCVSCDQDYLMQKSPRSLLCFCFLNLQKLKWNRSKCNALFAMERIHFFHSLQIGVKRQ